MLENNQRRYLGILGFAVFLLVPSFDTVFKYTGIKGILAYFLAGTFLLLIGDRFILPIIQTKLTEKHANILVVFTLIALIAMVVYAYPLANSGRYGNGSDSDDALIIGASELLKVHYPYYLQTYLGNNVSPMPGAILFAVPFVLVGMFPFQNVFWFIILFIFVRQISGSSNFSLGLLWVILLFSPTVLWNFVTGSDYASNSIYVVFFIWVLVRKASDQTAAEWKRLIPAILLGVALSSRSNFLLLLPLLLSVLVQTAGWRPAIKYLAVSGVSFLLVTVPFWLYDPQGFTPLYAQGSKVRGLNEVLPFAGIIIPASALLLASILSLQNLKMDCARFFRNCAIVQLFVLLFTCGVSSIKLGNLDLFLGQAGYGMFTLFFGTIAGWMMHNGVAGKEWGSGNVRLERDLLVP